MENSEQITKPTSKRQIKQVRKELIKDFKPSSEQLKRENLIYEELTYKKIVTEDWDDFHQF